LCNVSFLALYISSAERVEQHQELLDSIHTPPAARESQVATTACIAHC